MVKKKKVKKSKKKISKRFDQKKYERSLKSFIVYAFLSLILYGFTGVFASDFAINLFWALSIITGVMAFAFFIIVLVFIFLRWFGK